ncbi:beta-galactosidase [Halalkalibacter sp. AB-rgal2]|uniref:beta-galactosidase n=1 Tax=Halalkalibacter sp. AB-rgal2 TaxID=3242695 RepID=UPI00359E6901
MREYSIDVKGARKEIYRADLDVQGTAPNGDQWSLTNYYLKKNGQPFFGISGEFHFSRYDDQKWEDELIKMKMAGITIVPTYVFWNHHEEERGVYEWSGNKDVRRFVELCQKHGLYVILRIGPFAHGEARNGGMPDWLFGRPFDLRSNDDEYVSFVERFYTEIAEQINGLLFGQGGPIIGTQIENEFEHAGAPWEITTGTAQEWVSAGKDGDSHIKVLKDVAIKVGIKTPLYTATGWGGAAAPAHDVLPLWGGYAFWPWIFYGDETEHPATSEYVYRSFHEDGTTYAAFTPNYPASSLPYACCEMGGGMTVFYKYRFQLPYESVDAMANMKVAGGCNFVGYYVFHGGSHPKGKKTAFLNETATPKISYDYQAPLGEFGQVRESYKRLKRQHYFYQQCEQILTKMKTVLPENADQVAPTDVDTLRYAVRADGDRGFLFINNYQDHVELKNQEDFAIALQLEEQRIRVPQKGTMSLAKGESCILPYRLSLSSCTLLYATTQYMTQVEYQEEVYHFFFTPKGMSPEYSVDKKGIVAVHTDAEVVKDKTAYVIRGEELMNQPVMLECEGGKRVHICTLTHEESLNFWKVNLDGQERAIVTNAVVLVDQHRFRLECQEKSPFELKAFPAFRDTISSREQEIVHLGQSGIFHTYRCKLSKRGVECEVEQVSDAKVKVRVPDVAFDSVKELLLNVDYEGDIGYAFIDGELIHDNFCNQTTWQIGLTAHEEAIKEKGMYLYISPLKEDSYVKSDSPMAARSEVARMQIAKIKSVWVSSVVEMELVDY